MANLPVIDVAVNLLPPGLSQDHESNNEVQFLQTQLPGHNIKNQHECFLIYTFRIRFGFNGK